MKEFMESLSRRIGFLWAIIAILGATVLAVFVIGLVAVVFELDVRFVPIIWGVFALIGIGYGIVKYRRWGIDIQEEALFLTRGVITQVDTSVPYVRVQHIDTKRGPLERTLGLASVVVYTAGSRGADIRIPGLDRQRADEVREQLQKLSVESEATDAV